MKGRIKILISIIIPCYNSAGTIESTVESVLNQSYTNFELILVNDGSKDSTLEILVELQKKDKRIKIYNQENKGVSSARNMGIDKAEGDYICFVDSDDTIESTYINENLNEMISLNADLVIFGYRSIRNDKEVKELISQYKELKIITSDRYKVICKDNYLINPPFNKIYKSSILNDHTIRFPIDMRIGEDAVFNRSYLLCTQKIIVNPRTYYNYLINEDSAMRDLKDDYEDQLKNMASKASFLETYGLDFNHYEYIINNAYHKSNLIFESNCKIKYINYKKSVKRYKMYQSLKKIKFVNFLGLSYKEKIKYFLLRVLFFDFLIKKIKKNY